MKNHIKIFFLAFVIACVDSTYAYQFPYNKSLTKNELIYNRSIGISDAKAHLRLGRMILLMIGGERIEWKEKIRLNEYQKYGIEWRSTGDVVTDEFEDYRDGFNEVMKKEITAWYGKDAVQLIDLIENEINAKIMLETLKRNKGKRGGIS
ncbi:MAG: hypothetical protein HY253_03275 [Burkholderiales bacterium]|nr:hypothetical protein [Burkholderiales bacterium]